LAWQCSPVWACVLQLRHKSRHHFKVANKKVGASGCQDMESADGRDPQLFSQRVVEYISHEMEPASFVQAHPLRLAAALATNENFCTRVLFHQNSNIPNLATLLVELQPFFSTQLSSPSLELGPEALSRVQPQRQRQVPTTGVQGETNQDNVPAVFSESTRTHIRPQLPQSQGPLQRKAERTGQYMKVKCWLLR
jgi:hypothetical protein